MAILSCASLVFVWIASRSSFCDSFKVAAAFSSLKNDCYYASIILLNNSKFKKCARCWHKCETVSTHKKYKDIFMKSAVNWNDGLFSEHVYKRDDVLCISPIPSLACHMHEVAMSPLVDWKKLIE